MFTTLKCKYVNSSVLTEIFFSLAVEIDVFIRAKGFICHNVADTEIKVGLMELVKTASGLAERVSR